MKNDQTFLSLFHILSNYVAEDADFYKIFSTLITRPGISDIVRELDVGIFDSIVYGLNNDSAPIIEDIFTKMEDLLYKDILNHVSQISLVKTYRKNIITFFFDYQRTIETVGNDRKKIVSIADVFEKYAKWMPQKIVGILDNKKQLPPLIIKDDFQKINGILNNLPQELVTLIGMNLITKIEVQLSHNQCLSNNKTHQAIKTVDIISLEKSEDIIGDIDFWKYSYHLIGTPVDSYLHLFFTNLEKAKEILVRKFRLSDPTAYEVLYRMSFFSIITEEKLLNSTRFFIENIENFPSLRIPDSDISKKLEKENLLATASLFLSPSAFTEVKDYLSLSNFDLVKKISIEMGFTYLTSLLQLAERYNEFLNYRIRLTEEREAILKLRKEANEIVSSLNDTVKNLSHSRSDKREIHLEDLDNMIENLTIFAKRYDNKYLLSRIEEIKKKVAREKGKYLEKKKFFGLYKIKNQEFVSWLSLKYENLQSELESSYLKNSKYWALWDNARKTYKEFLDPSNLVDNLTRPVDRELIDFIKQELTHTDETED